jgi:hypothetical protein
MNTTRDISQVMKKSIITSMGGVTLAAASLLTFLHSSASEKSPSLLAPPEYPKECDTIDLPAGFHFPELTSELPYDLGSLQSDPETKSATPAECEIFEVQKMFDLFSWQTFVGLNWPADDKGAPLPGKIGSSPKSQRVWETYLSPSQIFKKKGATPDKWGTPESVRGLKANSKHTHILDEVDEAFFNLETPMPPITDLNNAYVRYEIRINEEEYNYLVRNKLYSAQGQADFIKNKETVSFPNGALTEEALAHTVRRIKTVQDFLERPLILENPSTYLEFEVSTINDWEFLGRMAEEANCGILLDVNNIHGCARNHGWDAQEYMQFIPADHIIQFHLTGHEDCGTHIIDTHNTHVIDEVWELYRQAHRHVGKDGASTLLEWDADLPEFPVLMEEVAKANHFMGESRREFTSTSGSSPGKQSKHSFPILLTSSPRNEITGSDSRMAVFGHSTPDRSPGHFRDGSR